MKELIKSWGKYGKELYLFACDIKGGMHKVGSNVNGITCIENFLFVLYPLFT